MAEFDSEVLHDQNAQLAQENIQLRNSFETQTQEISYLRNMVQQPAQSALPTPKSLNLPLPPRFSGSYFDISSFKLRLIQYPGSNMDAYADSHVDAIATSTQLYPLLFNTNSDSKLSSYSNAQNTFTYSYSYSYCATHGRSFFLIKASKIQHQRRIVPIPIV